MGRTIIEKGTTVRVTMTYTNAASGALEDPAVVTLKVRKPSGVIDSSITPTSSTVGVWQALIPTDEEGTWYARFYATSPNKVDTVSFDVVLDPDF